MTFATKHRLKTLPLIALLALAGCATSPMYEEVRSMQSENSTKAAADAEKTIPVFVVKHQYHTGVILPADAASRVYPQIVREYAEQSGRTHEYWEFGWGDEKFFTAEYTDVGLAVRAMIAPTSSLLHVIGLNRHPDRYFKNIEYKLVHVTPKGYEKMLEYIRRSVILDAGGQLTQTIKAKEPDRLFYKARGEYAMFNNCNHWTAGLLAVGGLDVRPNTLTGDQILQQVGGVDFKKP